MTAAPAAKTKTGVDRILNPNLNPKSVKIWVENYLYLADIVNALMIKNVPRLSAGPVIIHALRMKQLYMKEHPRRDGFGELVEMGRNWGFAIADCRLPIGD